MKKLQLTKKRAKLLAELEHLVGKNCYNPNTQNWGPDGVYKGEGRGFRYPLTMIDERGGKRKRSYPPATDVSPEMLATGYYACGANRFHIIKALDDVLQHLENHHGLKV